MYWKLIRVKIIFKVILIRFLNFKFSKENIKRLLSISNACEIEKYLFLINHLPMIKKNYTYFTFIYSLLVFRYKGKRCKFNQILLNLVKTQGNYCV